MQVMVDEGELQYYKERSKVLLSIEAIESTCKTDAIEFALLTTQILSNYRKENYQP